MTTPCERFWPKVDRNGPVHPVLGTPCWLWTAGLDRDGYGMFREGATGSRARRAHSVSFEWVNGPIPEGLVPDHLCHTHDPDCPGGRCYHRACVNPEHVEAVTTQENTRRRKLGAQNAAKTECPRGHAYDEENTYINQGKRYCRACNRATALRLYREGRNDTLRTLSR